jgi:hypothetical protein
MGMMVAVLLFLFRNKWKVPRAFLIFDEERQRRVCFYSNYGGNALPLCALDGFKRNVSFQQHARNHRSFRC